MRILSLLALAACAVASLTPMTLPRLQARHHALVALFYDGETSDAAEVARVRSVLEETEGLVAPKWRWYEVDTSSRVSAALAEEGDLRGSVSVFVRTPEDGIDEYTLPMDSRHLSRFLQLRGVAGNPADVRPVSSGAELRNLVLGDGGSEASGVLIKFEEPWCAYCLRMRRQFESAATLFRGQVKVASVDCSQVDWCGEEGVEEYPTIRLYVPSAMPKVAGESGAVVESGVAKGTSWVVFQGSRVAAAYELFLHSNSHLLPPLPPSSNLKKYTFDTSLPAPSIYPLKGQPDPSAETAYGTSPDAEDFMNKFLNRIDQDEQEEQEEQEEQVLNGKGREVVVEEEEVEEKENTCEEELEETKTQLHIAKQRIAKLERAVKKLSSQQKRKSADQADEL